MEPEDLGVIVTPSVHLPILCIGHNMIYAGKTDVFTLDLRGLISRQKNTSIALYGNKSMDNIAIGTYNRSTHPAV